jgi:D-Tyr-tRNAtyr deacylase
MDKDDIFVGLNSEFGVEFDDLQRAASRVADSLEKVKINFDDDSDKLLKLKEGLDETEDLVKKLFDDISNNQVSVETGQQKAGN